MVNQSGIATVTKSNKPEETEGALANYIQETDDNFFKSVEPFTLERQKLQSKVIQLYTQLCRIILTACKMY